MRPTNKTWFKITIVLLSLLLAFWFALGGKFNEMTLKGLSESQVNARIGAPDIDSRMAGEDRPNQFFYGYYDWLGGRHRVHFTNGVVSKVDTSGSK